MGGGGGGRGIIENNFHLYDGRKRMKRNAGFLAGLVAVVMVLVGCTSTEALGRFTLISSKNVELSRLGEMTKHAESQKTGNKDLNLNIFWFIPARRVSQSYELENALDSVIEKIPGGELLLMHNFLFMTKKVSVDLQDAGVISLKVPFSLTQRLLVQIKQNLKN